MTGYLFSDFSARESQRLHACLSSLMDISKNQWDESYHHWRNEFENDHCPELTFPRQVFKSVDPQFQQTCDKALLFGADFPSLLEHASPAKSINKTIVILGQDPLRSGTKRVENITVATPYGLHLKECREVKRNTRVYFEMIKVLLEEGYRVYLTDIYKIWVSQENCDRHVSLTQKEKQRFIQVLKEEIEIMNASAVITWGGVATHFANRNLDIPPLSFPHPSGAANGKWKELLKASPTQENKIKYWREEVTAALAA